MSKRKFLFIRLSSIGDVILTSPIIRTFAQQLDAEIHFITKPAFIPLLKYNPHINRIIDYELIDDNYCAKLREEGFEAVIDLHKNLRSRKIIKQLRLKSTSFNKINIRKWLYVNFKRPHLPNQHLVDRYFDAFQSYGVQNDGKGLEFHIGDNIQVKDLPKGYTCLALGAAHATKRIPLEKLKALIKPVIGKTEIVLIGGKQDSGLATELVTAFPSLIDYTGKLSLQESGCVIRDAKLLVSPDTGMMHMAVGLKVPVIVLWGNTVPELGMFPMYGDEAPLHYNFEVDGLRCRPCSKIGHDSCPKGHFKCMVDQDSSRIVEKILEFID